LQGFMQGHWGQNGGQTLRQHGLSCSRRTYQNDIVPTGRSNFHTAFDTLLPFYIGKIMFRKVEMFMKLLTGIHIGSFQRDFQIKEIHHLLDVPDSIDLKVLYNGGLAGIFLWKDESLETLLLCLYGNG